MIINDVQFNASLEDIIDELVRQLRINNIEYLQKIKNIPDSIMVQCPYHSNGTERRPSAGIRKSDGKFHCFAFGEIHELYEVISFCFGHYNDILGKFGWNWLLKNFATVQIEQRKPIELNFSRDKKKQEVKYVSEEELDKYRYYHPYWRKRGIVNEEIIELFDLGFDEATNCITFPVRDIHGNCLFIARRSIHSKYFNYPQGVEKPLYGLYELKEYASSKTASKDIWHLIPTEIIVCESMLDALSFWQIGKYAVALNGVGSELQFKQLRELPCRKLILCTDSDRAGMKARNNIRRNVRHKIITEYILPEGKKDANECTPEELKNLQEVF